VSQYKENDRGVIYYSVTRSDSEHDDDSEDDDSEDNLDDSDDLEGDSDGSSSSPDWSMAVGSVL
jgi:hypothetical protein